MFTKLFKKSHDPYELGGRWYKISIDADREDFSIISSDISLYELGDTVFNIGIVFETNEIIFVNCDILSIVPVPKSLTGGDYSLPANYRVEYDEFKYYNFSLYDFTNGSVSGKIDLYVYAIPYAKTTTTID